MKAEHEKRAFTFCPNCNRLTEYDSRYGNDDDSGMSYWCTACNFQLSEDLFYSGYKNGRWIENGVFKYCPNCGARMDGAE